MYLELGGFTVSLKGLWCACWKGETEKDGKIWFLWFESIFFMRIGAQFPVEASLVATRCVTLEVEAVDSLDWV